MNLLLRQLNAFLLLVCLVITNSQRLCATELELPTLRYNLAGTSAWVPYGYFGDPKKPGIFADIIHAIMQHTNIPYEFYYYPPKRAGVAIEAGKLDFDFMSLGWFKDGDIGDDFVTSVAIFELVEYIVTLPQNARLFAQPEAIYGKRVGTVAGYSYHDDDKFTRVDFLTESNLIEGLAKQRFDAVILEAMTAFYWADVHQVVIELAAIHSQGDTVIRLRKEHNALVPHFNRAILLLQQNGQIEKILRSYHVKSHHED